MCPFPNPFVSPCLRASEGKAPRKAEVPRHQQWSPREGEGHRQLFWVMGAGRPLFMATQRTKLSLEEDSFQHFSKAEMVFEHLSAPHCALLGHTGGLLIPGIFHCSILMFLRPWIPFVFYKYVTKVPAPCKPQFGTYWLFKSTEDRCPKSVSLTFFFFFPCEKPAASTKI